MYSAESFTGQDTIPSYICGIPSHTEAVTIQTVQLPSQRNKSLD